MPYLKSLDISWNPLRVLTKESFQGLARLQDLVVQYLPDLKRFDADSLSHLHYLTNLAIQVGYFFKGSVQVVHCQDSYTKVISLDPLHNSQPPVGPERY